MSKQAAILAQEATEQKKFAKRINFDPEELKRLYYDLHGVED